jgi:hypothetical protein
MIYRPGMRNVCVYVVDAKIYNGNVRLMSILFISPVSVDAMGSFSRKLR